MTNFLSTITSAQARKLWAALGGVISIIVAANILPEQYRTIAEAVLGLLTSAGVYAVPNAAPTMGAHEATSTFQLDRGNTIG